MSSNITFESCVRDYTFVAIRETRPAMIQKKKLVSQDFLDKVEAKLRARIFADVRAADGGKLVTLRPPGEGKVKRPEGAVWLINGSKVEEYVRKVFEGTSLKLISSEYYDYLDNAAREIVISLVGSMLTTGKTVR